MSAAAKKKSALERRLEELEKEEVSLRGGIRRHEKRIQKATDRGSAYYQHKPTATSQPPSCPDGYRQTSQSTNTSSDSQFARSTFARRNAPTSNTSYGSSPRNPFSSSQDYPQSQQPQATSSARRQETADSRFAAYLTAGSFVPSQSGGPLSKKVIRNRIIFFVILAVVVAIIAFQLIRIF